MLWPGLVTEVLLRWINYAVVLHPTSEAPTTPLVQQSCKIQAAADTDTVTHLWRVVNDDGEGLWDRIFWRDPTHSALHKKSDVNYCSITTSTWNDNRQCVGQCGRRTAQRQPGCWCLQKKPCLPQAWGLIIFVVRLLADTSLDFMSCMFCCCRVWKSLV